MLIIGGSGSIKTNVLLNLIIHQPNIDQIYLYSKNLYEPKHQLLINKRRNVDLKHCNGSKVFIEYSNDISDIYENINKYKGNKKRKILIAFDGMIADMLSNKKLQPTVIELFIIVTKINIFLVFITQYYFAVLKNSRPNSTHYFIIKISKKRELQQITINHSSDFTDLKIFTKYVLQERYSFLVNDTTLASDNPL